MHTHRTRTARVAPMSLLFARYVAGQIEDSFWDQFMQVLDANDTPPQDRLAFAAFFNDAVSVMEPGAVKPPHSQELADLLADVYNA